MPKAPVYLTAEGRDELQSELNHLLTVGRPEMAATILSAREDGDLKENAAYHDAKDRQGLMEARIRVLTFKLERAEIVSETARDYVDLGATVTVASETGEEETYTIVGSTEAKVLAHRISNESPLGRALVGRKMGDSTVVKAPQGELHYRLVGITWPEKG